MHLTPATLPEFLPPALATELAGAQRTQTEHEGVRTVWHLWGAPERPAVVLLHGGSGSWLHWVRNIGPLLGAGYRVLVPDLPGFGDSDLPPGCTDVPQLPVHLHAGLQQLAPKGPVQFVGFSFGGMAAALWLAEHPQDATHLVLVGAPGLGLSTAQRVALKGWRHLPSREQQDAVHRHNLMALMFERPESLDALALALHAANVVRDRMPRRRLSSTPIVAEALPRVKARVSAIARSMRRRVSGSSLGSQGPTAAWSSPRTRTMPEQSGAVSVAGQVSSGRGSAPAGGMSRKE